MCADRATERTALSPEIEQIEGGNQPNVDIILKKIVQILPATWRNPTSAKARIIWGDRLYQAGDINICQSVLASEIKDNDNVYGSITDGYPEAFEEASEGPFLAEERLLLDIIATRIGSLIARTLAEEGLINSLKQHEMLYMQLLSALGCMAEMRDPYTAGHQNRVTALAVAIASEMGWPARQIKITKLAASIHDIGKSMVLAEILCKPTKLTHHEYDLIKDHADVGYNILKYINFPWPVARIVVEHRERIDGSGYPNGLHSEKLMMESRIVAVAFVVESMCAHRPYRAGLGSAAALAEISQNRGLLYDHEVVDACLRLFNEKDYPCRI